MPPHAYTASISSSFVATYKALTVILKTTDEQMKMKSTPLLILIFSVNFVN
jgi:hypothetical protein